MRTRLSITVGLVLLAVTASAATKKPAPQQTFPSADDAATAVIEAAKNDDLAALERLFGKEAMDVLGSGDDVADRNERHRFADWAAQKKRLDPDGDDRMTLVVGNEDWPFPIPIVRAKDGTWHFDTEAGLEEIVNRRIGRNELSTIDFVRQFVEAEHEYAAADPEAKGFAVYAQHIRSAPGTRNGLYWEATDGQPASPLGPLAAAASQEGYKATAPNTERMPFHGYYFKILTAQGKQAPGGAKSYVDKAGNMTGGFALVAWPVEYRSSGVMTFIVNRQGVVFQKDLGKQTGTLAAGMKSYDPDASWHPVAD